MIQDAQEMLELLQGPVAKAIAKKIEEEHKAKLALFEKTFQALQKK